MVIKDIWGILVLGLLFSISPNLYSENTGCKFLKNYSYKEYGHHPQNWGMVQADNGIIYVANQGGMLEFDGVSWRVLYDPPSTVRSLAIDETGTIYIGGNGEIGYLAPNPEGTLKYISLLSHLEDDHKNFATVWSTHTAKEGVYFRTTKFLFRWNWRTGKMKVWEKLSIRASFLRKGTLVVQKINAGLMQMKNDSLNPVPGGDAFTGKKILMLVSYDDGRDSQNVLIGTSKQGFFLYDGKVAKPFLTEADDYLKKNQLYRGIRLSSGDFALATLRGGLVVIDPRGHLKHIFDEAYGLQDNTVYNVFQDMHENLWLCLSKGIAKIEYTSPISIYDERSNLPGLILSIARHHNGLYVGTNNGLYVLESPSKFHLITGIHEPDISESEITNSYWSLLSIGDSILAATSSGVFQVGKNTRRNVVKGISFALLPSKRYPGRIWCGTYKGLLSLSSRNGQWVVEWRFEFKNINQDIRSIVEDDEGNLFLVNSTRGVLKVDSPDNREDYVVSTPGLPAGEIYSIVAAAGHVILATKKGIFRFDEKENKFIPDETLGMEFAGGHKESKPVFRLVEDKNKNIWFHSQSRNYQAVPGPGGTVEIYSTPFLRIPDTNQVNVIYPDPDGKTVWFGGSVGLFRYDKTIKKDYHVDFSALIRKVIINGNLIFDGYKYKTDSDSGHLITTIDYRDRKSFHFEVAATFYEAEAGTKYRYLLDGHDDHWSAWESESNKDFTILDSGMYRFRVQARNVYGQSSREAVFQFKILPPWYRTWWALLIYSILFFLMVFLIVRWRSEKLEQEKQRLEQIIKERTKEIQKYNQKLEEQSEKLMEMDRVKSRFFANISHEFRTPLTLIMSPLEQMLDDSRDKKQKRVLNVMLQNSQRLLTLINQLLDLSRIDSGKMKLQATYQNIIPFLKGILKSFHIIAQKNKLEMEFHAEEEEIFLTFDAQKIEEAMYNLLINAIKFTPPGGNIMVSVSMVRWDHPKEGRSPLDFVKISVRDTGIGIPREQLGHIFDRFYQAKIPKDKFHKGTGIGLALTKEIVLLHHGKIDVHSQLRKGTEFVIHLPMGDEYLMPEEMAISSGIPAISPKSKELETLYVAAEAETEEEGEEEIDLEKDVVHKDKSVEQEKPVILVVEDEADVRKYIREPLESFYTVVEAGDGKEGIDKAKEIIPDLIVSDIMMPEVDGYELCKELKKDVKTSHVPIILLTAKASEESIIQGLETGADDYITKPFNSKILLTRIKNLIDLRRQLQLKIQREKMLLPKEIAISSTDETFLRELQDIIEENLGDPDFGIDELCKKLYMGRSNLFRKIQALTGEIPGQFIQSYRLERGAQLLRENYGNVTEVAMAVGFSSPQYFAKLFKEKFHRSPSSYKASESKGEV